MRTCLKALRRTGLRRALLLQALHRQELLPRARPRRRHRLAQLRHWEDPRLMTRSLKRWGGDVVAVLALLTVSLLSVTACNRRWAWTPWVWASCRQSQCKRKKHFSLAAGSPRRAKRRTSYPSRLSVNRMSVNRMSVNRMSVNRFGGVRCAAEATGVQTLMCGMARVCRPS